MGQGESGVTPGTEQKEREQVLRGALEVAGDGRGFQMREFHFHPCAVWEPLGVSDGETSTTGGGHWRWDLDWRRGEDQVSPGWWVFPRTEGP